MIGRRPSLGLLAGVAFLVMAALAWSIGAIINKGFGIAIFLAGAVVVWRIYSRR